MLNSLLIEIRTSSSLELVKYKQNIKRWKPFYPCKICKDLTNGVGFVITDPRPLAVLGLI